MKLDHMREPGVTRAGEAMGARSSRPTLDASEVAVGGAALLVAVGAWASLALAHVGMHSGGAAVAITLAVATVALAALRRYRVRVTFDRRLALATVGVGVVAAVFTLPGFPYGLADKDPGVYMAHGHAIARTGSYDLHDPVLETGEPGSLFLPGARFPGIWIDDAEAGRVVPQFYHLLPSALATAHDIGRRFAIVNFVPVTAVFAAMALVLVARRAFGLLAGTLAGLLLATNMMQVWSAKNPQTEVVTQLFVVAASLGVVVALQERWRPAAAVAGLLTGVALLARPDSIFLVLFVAGVGAALVAFRRWDARAGWFAAGLAPPLTHGLVQAYGTAEQYTLSNDVPALERFAVLLALLAVAAAVWRYAIHSRAMSLARRFSPEVAQRRAGLAIAGVSAVLLGLAWFRPTLFGDHTSLLSGVETHDWQEENLLRLSWFFTVPGIVAMWAGLAFVAIRRWRAVAWAALLPAVLLLPIYVYDARVSPRLMWWTRRFVPFAIVAIVVLIAVAIASALRSSGRGARFFQALGAGVLVVILGAQVAHSWPLRTHREFDGSFAAVDELDVLTGGQESLFLWVRGPGLYHPARNLAGPVWLAKGHLSTLLADPPDPLQVKRYAQLFPDHPVYVVASGEQLPGEFGALQLERVHHFTRLLPFWEETFDSRPDEPQSSIVLAFTVWEFERS